MEIKMEDAGTLLKIMEQGLLCWYDFKENAEILYISKGDDGLSDLFRKKELRLTTIADDEYCEGAFLSKHKLKYDYIVALEEIEKGQTPKNKLDCMKKLLKQEGVLLLGANNRLGIRYFCGDKDNYSSNCFDGIDNYIMLSARQRKMLGGKNYSKAELKRFLREAGWENIKFYSVFPNLKVPQHIFSEDYTPNEELNVRLVPEYENKEAIFLREEFLYTDLIENGLFHAMANCFLIECSCSSINTNVNHVTCALDRERENAQTTIIRSNGIVEKEAFYEEGKNKYKNMCQNADDLRKHGVRVLDADVVDGKYVMKYIDSENAEVYLRRLAFENRVDEFVAEVDRFRKNILHSSEWVENGKKGVILKKAYVDMIPLNCFVIDGEFVFYDPRPDLNSRRGDFLTSGTAPICP